MQLPTVENKLSEFDSRLSRVEGIVEQISIRLTNLETRVDSGFRWVIGLLVTVLLAQVGTVITILLTAGK